MRLRVVIATALVLSVTLVAAGPGSAAVPCPGSNATNAPDGRIRLGSGPYEGGGTYTVETLSAGFLPVGQEATFTLKWKNRTSSTQTVRVSRVTDSQHDGFSVRYFVNGVNVNDILKGGQTLVFPGVAPQSTTPALVLIIKTKSNVAHTAVEPLRGRFRGSTGCDVIEARAYGPGAG